LKWTPKEEEILRRLVERGHTAKEISQVLKSRTVNGIHSKAEAMGFHLPGGAPEIDMGEFERMIKAARTVKKYA
jgi:PP-loop superfamily ATP-utilizing enzyme